MTAYVLKRRQDLKLIWHKATGGRGPFKLAMRRLAMSGAMVAGSTSSVQRRFAAKAREWQSSTVAVLNEVHSLLHPIQVRRDQEV